MPFFGAKTNSNACGRAKPGLHKIVTRFIHLADRRCLEIPGFLRHSAIIGGVSHPLRQILPSGKDPPKAAAIPTNNINNHTCWLILLLPGRDRGDPPWQDDEGRSRPRRRHRPGRHSCRGRGWRGSSVMGAARCPSAGSALARRAVAARELMVPGSVSRASGQLGPGWLWKSLLDNPVNSYGGSHRSPVSKDAVR